MKPCIITISKFAFRTELITLVSLYTLVLLDLLITSLLKTRGFSQFYETSAEVGFINRRNFSVFFGGPLDDFTGSVNCTTHGTRKTASKGCLTSIKPKEIVIIVGDSMTAGWK